MNCLNKKKKNHLIYLIIHLKAQENFIKTIIPTQNFKDFQTIKTQKLKSKNMNKNLRKF